MEKQIDQEVLLRVNANKVIKEIQYVEMKRLNLSRQSAKVIENYLRDLTERSNLLNHQLRFL